jgi:serine phosphatase RsbU (regulator of sigma subunit)
MSKAFTASIKLFAKGLTRGIPQAYQAEYIEKLTILVRSRVQLLCKLVVVIYFLSTTISYAISSSTFDLREIPLGIFLILTALLILRWNKKAKNIALLKANTYLFVIFSLIFLTRLSIVYKEYFNVSASLYLFALFTVSFTIPWLPGEIAIIASLHALTFSRLFIYIRRHLPPQDLAGTLQSYSDGILLIFMGFILCYVLRRKENDRQIENYLLLKEVESKNEQMRKELELATRIHKTLIPHSINTDKADIAVLYLPMYYIGGDYAKFQFIDNDKLIFIIADVTGHGVSAALMVNRLHTEVERLIREGKGPGALLSELNDLIMKQFSGINIFLSAFSGLFDFKNMKLFYSNHGHPAQYIYHITKSAITRLSSQTTLLGLSSSEGKIHQHCLNFDKGDRMLLFTDGVIETKNKSGEFYGTEHLEHFIAANYKLSVEQFNQCLLNDLSAFKRGDFQDDIFILNIHAK